MKETVPSSGSVLADGSQMRKRFIRWMEDNRGLILTVFGLPASFMFDIVMQVIIVQSIFLKTKVVLTMH